MILLIDNYDSFTYNIAQYALECGEEILVKRNDEITLDEIRSLNPRGILLSPGPCTPDKAGITESVIREFAGKIPIFGVCLGMQAIGEVFGGKIVPAKHIMHGKASFVEHNGKGIFEGIPSPIRAIRYHSLVVDRNSLPDELRVLATSDDEEIMALEHREYDVQGVQFHPESVLTEHGHRIIENWLSRVRTL